MHSTRQLRTREGPTMVGPDFATLLEAIRQATYAAFVLDPDGNNMEAVFRS